MSYNDPKPAKRGPGQPKKGRVRWSLKFTPQVKAAIERAAARKGQKPSDFVNDHFSPLAGE